MKKQMLQTLAIACAAQSMWLAGAALAQEEPDERYDFRYTAYFVCGTPEQGSGGQLAFGKYATQINMANWHGKAVELRKKVAFTYPPRMQAYGVHSDWLGPEIIERNHALSVDCEEIVGTKNHPSEFHYSEGLPVLEDGSDPTFYTGYLIVQSNRSLNMTTVQTAGPRPGEGDSDKRGGKRKGDKEDKERPEVHTISVTNVPERLRAESQQHGDEVQ
jgi:hypothetical protein